MERRYPPFERTGLSFADRIGCPDEVDAAIGRVVGAFSDLEDQLAATTTSLLRRVHIGESISCGPMPFNRKVEFFAATFRQFAAARRFIGEFDCFGALEELSTNCFDAARRKEHVLSAPESYEDSSYLLDIADFIGSVAFHVDEFILVLEAFDDP